jgi:hypothetical protein
LKFDSVLYYASACGYRYLEELRDLKLQKSSIATLFLFQNECGDVRLITRSPIQRGTITNKAYPNIVINL